MYAIGVDLGGTNMRIGIVDENFSLKDVISLSSPKGYEREEHIYKNIADNIQMLISKNNLSKSDIKGIGIGVANAIRRKKNLEDNTVKYITTVKSNIKIIDGINLLKYLENVFGMPTVLENDVNVGAVGEYVTRKHKVSNLVAIYMGTGIGGGIIIDKKLYFGAHGVAMEVGHIILEHNGPKCICGNNGCWESISGGTGIANRAKEKIEQGEKGLIYEMAQGDINNVNAKINIVLIIF